MSEFVYGNGGIREQTAEEMKEGEAYPAAPAPAPSLEEEVAQLKADNRELREALDALLEKRVQ